MNKLLKDALLQDPGVQLELVFIIQLLLCCQRSSLGPCPTENTPCPRLRGVSCQAFARNRSEAGQSLLASALRLLPGWRSSPRKRTGQYLHDGARLVTAGPLPFSACARRQGWPGLGVPSRFYTPGKCCPSVKPGKQNGGRGASGAGGGTRGKGSPHAKTSL